jgi:gas vesicle protein
MAEEEKGYGACCTVLAFFLGGLVGAGIALLFAPKPGSETRQMIKEYAGETKGKAEAYLEKFKESATSVLEKGKEFVEEQKIILTSAVEAGKEAYEKEKEKLTTERKD